MQTKYAKSSPKAMRPWTLGEKLILAGILLTITGSVSYFSWENSLEAPPVMPRPPTLSISSPSGYNDLVAAARMAIEPPGGRYWNGAPRPLNALDFSIVDGDANAFARLHRGLRLPVEVPVSLIASSGGDRTLLAFRSLARTLRIRGRIEESKGRWGDAVQTYLDAVELGEKQATGGKVLHWIIGAACVTTGRQPSWAAASHLDSRSARAAAIRLAVIEKTRTPLADNLTMEKYGNLAMLQDLFQRPDWRSKVVQDFATFPSDDPNAVTVANELNWMSKQRVVDLDVRMADNVITESKRPYARADPAPSDLVEQLFYAIGSPDLPFRQALDSTENRLLETVFALQAFRYDHGAYPVDLGQICPNYLPAVPGDPFNDNRPLRYRRRDETYLLWSIGPDGRDDGGRSSHLSSSRFSTVQSTSRGDIVAGIDTQ